MTQLVGSITTPSAQPSEEELAGWLLQAIREVRVPLPRPVLVPPDLSVYDQVWASLRDMAGKEGWALRPPRAPRGNLSMLVALWHWCVEEMYPDPETIPAHVQAVSAALAALREGDQLARIQPGPSQEVGT